MVTCLNLTGYSVHPKPHPVIYSRYFSEMDKDERLSSAKWDTITLISLTSAPGEKKRQQLLILNFHFLIFFQG